MSGKDELRIDWCSYGAARYAVEHWHYSKRMPKSKLNMFGIWEKELFTGCIIYGSGASPYLGNPYGLGVSQVCELVRIALRRHRTPVSKIISITMKMMVRKNPRLRLVVSFADPSQCHVGGVYQASNWIYTGVSNDGTYFVLNGRIRHMRGFSKDPSNRNRRTIPRDTETVVVPGKHRYLYPLDKEMRMQIECLRRPYPKALEA